MAVQQIADWLRRQPEGALLRHAFHALAGMAVLVVLADLREMGPQASTGATGIPSASPVPMERPAEDDQIRPYLPFSRPLDPDDPRRSRPRDENEAAPMHFRLGTHGAAFAEGTITPGTADAFMEFIEAESAAGVKEIVLHSPGGSVDDALDMASLIRERGLSTRVLPDGYCASSCPLVFAAGNERIADKTAWIGVHQVFALTNSVGSLAEGMEEAQRVSANAQSRLIEYGVDPRVWIHAMQTPKDQLYLFTPDELGKLKLATKVETVGDAS